MSVSSQLGRRASVVLWCCGERQRVGGLKGGRGLQKPKHRRPLFWVDAAGGGRLSEPGGAECAE